MNGKLSTPGVSAQMNAVHKLGDAEQNAFTYEIVVTGAPQNQTYKLLEWPINADSVSELMQGLTLSSDGLLICAGRMSEQCVGEKKDDPVRLTFSPAKGEVFRLALVSADGKAKIFFAVVPDPVSKQDNGCTLEIVRLTPRFEAALIVAKGYRPNETVQSTFRSYNEVQERQVTADSNGEYVSAVLPFVKDKKSGRTDIALKGANCNPALSFQWGK